MGPGSPFCPTGLYHIMLIITAFNTINISNNTILYVRMYVCMYVCMYLAMYEAIYKSMYACMIV